MKLKELLVLLQPNFFMSIEYKGKKHIGMALYPDLITGRYKLDEDFLSLGDKEVKSLACNKRANLIVKLDDDK